MLEVICIAIFNDDLFYYQKKEHRDILNYFVENSLDINYPFSLLSA